MKRVVVAALLCISLLLGSTPSHAASKSGTFRSSRKYSTVGTARIADTSKPVLRFSTNFRTSSGPRLRVYLSSAPVGSSESRYDDDVIQLGTLKSRSGAQSYTIPRGVNLSKYRTVVIWCDKFDVLFGTSRLG